MSLFFTLTGYASALPLMLAATLLALAQYALARRRPFDRVIRFFARACILACGVRLRVSGRRHVPVRGAVLFMANHVSILDPLVLFAVFDRTVYGVELEDHFRWPVWGTLTRAMGNIPISHRDTRSAVGSLDDAASALRRGVPIAILPEGHRTRDGRLGRFGRGPFVLALRAGVDIVPMAIRGLYRCKNVHSPRFHPGRVDVRFGAPIPRTVVEGLTSRALRDLVRSRVAALLGETRSI